MRISANGLNLVKRFEGCKLTAYQDVAGVWTVGFGHVGPEVRKGLEISQSLAESLLLHDMEQAEETVTHLTSTVTLTQNQFDALVSFEFNTGGLARSTLLKELLAKDFDAAANELLRWDKATDPKTGLKFEVAGLKQRREAERSLFLS